MDTKPSYKLQSMNLTILTMNQCHSLCGLLQQIYQRQQLECLQRPRSKKLQNEPVCSQHSCIVNMLWSGGGGGGVVGQISKTLLATPLPRVNPPTHRLQMLTFV